MSAAIFILGMLWNILFGRFDKADKVSPLRALFWEGVHFPLHFAMLLLLAAIVNTIINLSVYNGVEEVTGLASYPRVRSSAFPDSAQLQSITGALQNGTDVPEPVQIRTSELLDRLSLEPT